MSKVIVGTWGKNLAVRIPRQLAEAAGLSDGEEVEIEPRDGDILIRRSQVAANARKDAQAAAAEMIADSRRFSLGGLTIRDLIDEGRRY